MVDRAEMKVYLKLGDQLESVQDIYLKDGYTPMVGGIQPTFPDSKEPFQLDSALWYKTFVINTVYIECDKREVWWTRVNNEETIPRGTNAATVTTNSFSFEAAEKLHDDDVYDFDPTTDELLDRADTLMQSYTTKKIKEEEFQLEVTRLLHCYIFPSVHFHSRDILALQDALMRIESKSESIECEIIQKFRAVDLTEESLERQRKRILKNEDFHKENYVRSCGKEFLSVLYKHLEKDIDRANLKFETLQFEINKLKDSHPPDWTSENLQCLREERDSAFQSLEPLQLIREHIKNVLYRPRRSLKSKQKKIKKKANVFHDIYLEMTNRSKLQKEELQKLCIKKVKTSSVREAIHSAFLELNKSDGCESPFRTTDGSEFSLDIIGLGSKPESWQTLEQQVYSFVNDTGSEAHQIHQQSCKIICDRIQASVDENSMFGASTEYVDSWQVLNTDTSRLSSNSQGSSSVNRRHGRHFSDNSFLEMTKELDQLSAEACRKSVGSIKDDIRKHMEIMCSLLLKSIPECSERHRNKVWISYENILCSEILPQLTNLYKLCVSASCQSLHSKINRLSFSELLIDDHFLQLFIHGASGFPITNGKYESETTEVKRPVSANETDMPRTLSRISLEIRKCTLEELYNMADKDCRAFPDRVSCFLETESAAYASSDASSLPQNEDDSAETGSDTEGDNGSEEDFEEIDLMVLLNTKFSVIKKHIQESLKARSIIDKLRRLTKVFKLIGHLIVEVTGGSQSQMACADEVLTTIIILLRCLDKDTFSNLYAELYLLIDHRAPFLNGSVHDCCLTNFLGAYSFLFDSQVVKDRRSECLQ